MLKRWGSELSEVLYGTAAIIIGCVLVTSGVVTLGGQLVSLMRLGVQPRTLTVVAVLAIVVASWRTAVFVGPWRVSTAELVWTPERAEIRTALWASASIVAGTVAVLIGLLASITHNLGMNSVEIIAWVALAVGASAWAFRAAEAMQHEGHTGVPRWRLLRADANVRSVHSACISIDGAALTLLRDQRTRATRTPIIPTIQPTAFALARTIVARTATDQWRLAVSILACSTLGGIVLGPVLGHLIAAGGVLALALRQSRVWAAWRASALIRRSLSTVYGPAEAAMLAGTCTMPLLVGVTATLAAGWASALPGLATVPLAVVYVIVERTRALAVLERSGPLGTMIQLPDLGPVPVGLFSKVLSGWCSAGACCYIAIVHTSVIPALVLATLLGISAVRQRLS
ncbi:hypothetical protein ACFSYH_05390 [Populibacterium corticicola]|uniref:Uncharacterized protein n=1 Tax=Populibacterium corticicola TaxID=1812826 RepID=A0ABW5XDP2_9MICO